MGYALSYIAGILTPLVAGIIYLWFKTDPTNPSRSGIGHWSGTHD